MPEMSKYCKAYAVEDLHDAETWSGEPLPETGYVFLHDDYAVTAGVFRDVDVLLADATPTWVRFCEERLRFSVPPDILEAAAPAPAD